MLIIINTLLQKLLSPLLALLHTAMKIFQILPKITALGVVTEHSCSTCLLTQQATASGLCTCDQAKCGKNIIYPCLLRDEKTLHCTSASFFSPYSLPRNPAPPHEKAVYSIRETQSWLVQTRPERHKSNLFWLISWEKTCRGQLYGGHKKGFLSDQCIMLWQTLLFVCSPNSHLPPAFFITQKKTVCYRYQAGGHGIQEAMICYQP